MEAQNAVWEKLHIFAYCQSLRARVGSKVIKENQGARSRLFKTGACHNNNMRGKDAEITVYRSGEMYRMSSVRDGVLI